MPAVHFTDAKVRTVLFTSLNNTGTKVALATYVFNEEETLQFSTFFTQIPVYVPKNLPAVVFTGGIPPNKQ